MASSSGIKYPHPHFTNQTLPSIPKLTIFSFDYWKRFMVEHLSGAGMTGYIDGTIEPPPATIAATIGDSHQLMSNPDYEEWKEMDELVKGWILSTIDRDPNNWWLPDSYSLTAVTAKDLWMLIMQKIQRAPSMGHVDRVDGRQNLVRCFPLFKVALEGDCDALEEILKQDPNAVRAIVNGASETALMVAARIKTNNNFVKKLMGLMLPEDLAIQNSFGETALHEAAVANNVEAMTWMLKKNRCLLNIHNNLNQLPIHHAAMAGHRNSARYLLEMTGEDILQSPRGVVLVQFLITGGLFDICLSLLQRFPQLAVTDISPLENITGFDSAFLSGSNFNFWQRIVYSYLPTDVESQESHHKMDDVENPRSKVINGFGRSKKLNAILWMLVGKLVPQVKHIQEKKVMHGQALQLVKYVCGEIVKLDDKRARDLFGHPLANASRNGNVEVVEEILATFPSAIFMTDGFGHNLFHIAILNRRANVFNLIYQVKTLQSFFLSRSDMSYHTALHLVSYLAGGKEIQVSPHLRSSGPGAALQMQRELQWFKEVEKLSLPQDQEKRNINWKTPATIFTETHELLARDGEQWMKDRANSGLIIGTLIATIVFASAITVPGGTNNDTGLPVFSQHTAFLVFAVSDALALFMSVSSMLMFLGILTARYAVEDFLYSLPKRLIIALVTLFLSIIFMMVAFTTVVYMVFGKENRWVLGPVSSLASIPVILFVSLQFTPLLDIIKSTYWPGIFSKQSDRFLF